MITISHAKVVWQALKDAVKETPGKAGYIFNEAEISFKEMDEVSDRIASGLLKLGYRKGDRLGIIGLNQPEWLYTYYAAAKIGVVIVGLNVRYRDTELDYIINQSESRGLVTISEAGGMDYAAFFESFRDRIPSVKEFFFIGNGGFEGSLPFTSLVDGEVNRADLEKAQDEVKPHNLMIIIYTSGTTGRPKGAAITHKSQLAAARAQAEHCGIKPDDLMFLALPLNHVGGITCGTLTALLGKGTCVLIPMFNPDEIIGLSRKYPPTIWAGVPTMHALLLMNEDIGSLDTGRIRLVVTGGSNAEPGLLKSLYETFPNAVVMNLYGLSEASGALVLSPLDAGFDDMVRSIGKPIGDFKVKVVDSNGKEVPRGETGELHFKGDGVASGYFRMPEETEQTFDKDGWLHTGDMGYLDENGYIILMGRLKEMYIQGGFNVYPVEVENLISKHPKVAMVAGIGVPDPVMGEIGRFYIVPKPGSDLSPDEITGFCREHLADYKIPRQIVFCTSLPLTPIGKIMKSSLRQEWE
jgi:acyl-CoA synthetase (AMP-forming)/AMP-acid ligase II